MWTPATREQHSRSELRYSTDLTDAEWAVIEPLLPSANRLGRPRLWSLREIVNGILLTHQRAGLLHDAPEHARPRAATVRARRACGDLFEGSYG